MSSEQWPVVSEQWSAVSEEADKRSLVADHQPSTINHQPPTAVIGYGNELRGDDGLGRVAARRLAGQMAGVDVRDVHQLTLDLAEIVKEYERVILIDARAGERPGELYEERVAPTTDLPDPFSHYVSPGELLAITEGLYGARPEVILVGITAASFDVGEGLSPAVAAGLPALLARVRRLTGVPTGKE